MKNTATPKCPKCKDSKYIEVAMYGRVDSSGCFHATRYYCVACRKSFFDPDEQAQESDGR